MLLVHIHSAGCAHQTYTPNAARFQYDTLGKECNKINKQIAELRKVCVPMCARINGVTVSPIYTHAHDLSTSAYTHARTYPHTHILRQSRTPLSFKNNPKHSRHS